MKNKYLKIIKELQGKLLMQDISYKDYLEGVRILWVKDMKDDRETE